MEGKNLKTKGEEVKVKAPPLIQEADELRAKSDHVSTEAHAHAGLAYLFELILRDPVHPTLAKSLMRAFKSEPSQGEEPFELAELLEREAKRLHMHPVLLAVAMIWWGKEAEIAENETVGSADWQLVPISIRNHRSDLQEEFRELFSEIESLFRGSGLEPELGVQLLREKCRAIDHGLVTVLRSIEGHRSKRKRLFYSNSKNEIKAYYLLRVRRLKTSAKELSDLLSQAGERYDMNASKDRHRAQQKLHQWAEAFETLVDAVMLDLGYVRARRDYLEIVDPESGLNQ
jgi:ElaB/YqjD/DUF883 family membrane-anchored ribosome-binding protein